jgi:2-dehydropantoate 2-reductase
MPDYLPSMYHDFRLGRPFELQAIYEAPLAAARAAGSELPQLQMLLQMLRFIQQQGRGNAHEQRTG